MTGRFPSSCRTPVLIAATALALTGCSRAPAASPVEMPPAVSPSSAALAVASPSASSDPSTGQAPAASSATPASRSAAIAAAMATMRAYLRTDRSAAGWLAGVDPHLTQDAAAAAAGTEPALIPAHRITGPATLSAAATTTAAMVAVPTDAGIYRLLLVRERVGVWLTVHITVPAGTH